MDTLVSIGVLAAYLWSLYALFAGRAAGRHATYLEMASGVTALILLGRYLEARAKRSAGAALRALLELGAKQATVLRDGASSRPGRPLGVGRRLAAGQGRRSPPTVPSSRQLGGGTSMLTGEPVPARSARATR